jgi:tetratricopeptide (TPR) repeat protein
MPASRGTIGAGLAAWAAASGLLVAALDLALLPAPFSGNPREPFFLLAGGAIREEAVTLVLVGDVPVGDVQVVERAVEEVFRFRVNRAGPMPPPLGTIDPHRAVLDPFAFLAALTDEMPLDSVRVLGVTSFAFEGNPAPLGVSQREGKAAAVSLHRIGRELEEGIRRGGDPGREAARFRHRLFLLACRELSRTFLPPAPDAPCGGEGCLAGEADPPAGEREGRAPGGLPRPYRSADQFLQDLDGRDPFFCGACRERIAKAVRGPLNTPITYYHLGIYFEERGLADRAEEAYERALRGDPAFPRALNNLGAVRMRRGDLPRAEEALRRATEEDPRYALAHFNLGRVLARRGRPEDALRSFEACLQADPGMIAAWRDGGLLLRDTLADPARAREWFGRFVQAGGRDGAIRRWLEESGK